MTLLLFLFEVLVISLSGVMAPGPVTAAAIAAGARLRRAGALIALGHGIVEFPLIVLIVLGPGKILRLPAAQIVIGLAGGAFLFVMAFQMLGALRAEQEIHAKFSGSSPLLTGMLLSATNPYFLLWWATIGLALATTATNLGIWAFVLFAIVHWLCDFLWLWALSWASFKGSMLLGRRLQQVVLAICAAAMFVFGLCFAYKALAMLTDYF
ncbi:MAG: LysE family transporter [Planctomycetota bacterium]|jgi:threonine/homoserine/homoserine lactone efflux protein